MRSGSDEFNCRKQQLIDDSSTVEDFRLDHVRGLTGCSHFAMQAGRQPGGPLLADGLEKVELVVRGRCWALDGATEVEATPGTIIWHLPGDRLISRSDERDPYACVVITWTIGRRLRRRVPRFTRWEDPGEILAYCRQLVASFSDDRVDRRALALASYAHLQWRAHLWSSTAMDPAMPSALQRVLGAIAADPARNWTVADMADASGWSPSRLHTAFRQHIRATPHQHVLELRLRRAREMLAGTRYPLDEIARLSGLGCAAVLCRHFRRRLGQTPGDYRARQSA